MEKVLKFLEKLLPFFVLYPRWFQVLCVILLAQAFALIIIALILYPQVSRKKESVDKLKDISLNVDVLETAKLQTDTTVSYRLERDESGVKISARLPYLERVEQGGPIEPLSYTWEPFEWEYPVLDVKILNGGMKTVYFTEAVFIVSKSEPDMEPIPIVVPDEWRGNERHVRVMNDGWGSMNNLRVTFDLFPLPSASTKPESSAVFSGVTNVGNVSETVNIDFSDALAKAGAKIRELQEMRIVGGRFDGETSKVTVSLGGKMVEIDEEDFKLRRAALFGPFKDGGAIVSEILDYSTGEGSKKKIHKVKFSTIVFLFNEHLVGAPAPPTHEYAVLFDSSQDKYQRRVSISQVLKAGESDRFTFRIGCDKSSYHQFALKLIYDSNDAIESPPIELHMIVSRSGYAYVQKQVKKIEIERPLQPRAHKPW